jgi:hypothetical protein
MIVISFIYFDPDWPLAVWRRWPRRAKPVRVDAKLNTKGRLFCEFLEI